LMSMIARQHVYGGAPWSAERMTQELSVPLRAVNLVVDALCASGLLAVGAEEEPTYIPARDLATVSVKQLLDAVRRADEDRTLTPDALPSPVPVDMVMHKIEDAIGRAVGAVTLRDLAGPPPADELERSAQSND
jgi:membrane protein